MTLWLPHIDAKRVDAELRALDKQLFLAEHRDFFGRPYFEVRYHVGSETSPPVVVDWREEDGTPKPLTSQLFAEVQRIHSQGPPDVRSIVKRNDELKAKRNDEHMEAYEELIEDILPRMRGAKATIMPRAKSAVGPAARRQAKRDSERRRGVR